MNEAPRWAYVVFAMCLGAALAMLGYRFGVQPIGWNAPAKSLFQIGAPVLLIVGWQVLKGRDKKWPLALVIPLVIGTFAAVFGLSYLAYPPPDHARLTTKELPGFALDLPAGEAKPPLLDYMAGRYEVVDVVGTGDVMLVQWEPGVSATRDDLQLLAKGLGAAFGGTGAGTITQIPGAGGKPADTVEFATPKGPVRASIQVCGGRRITLLSGGNYIQGLHDRVVKTLACHPDPARESSLEDMPIAIDLPPAWKRVQGEAGQVSLTDGTSALILKPMNSLPSDDGQTALMLAKLFEAAGQKVTVGAKVDGRFPISGTMGGQVMSGFVWPFQCGKRGVFVMGLAPDAAGADQLAELVKTKSHCAGPNEVVKLPPLMK